MTEPRLYFPNLNGIRFFAALIVIIHHLEQYKVLFKIESYFDQYPVLSVMGPLGVVLFFVLSGFLITYLLMAEESRFQVIDIRQFYVRRILRIWPLYFLVLFLAFAVLPHISFLLWPDYPQEVVYAHWLPKLALFVFFLPNLVEGMYGAMPYVSHSWSIGVEEQFYLFWPVMFRAFKRHRLTLLVCVVVGHNLIGNFLASRFSAFVPAHDVLRAFWLSFNMNCMAIGSILGILLFQKHRLLQVLLQPVLFYVALVGVVVLALWGGHIMYFHYEVYAVLFGILILQLAAREQLSRVLENGLFRYLGKISYGLYMLHPLCVAIVIRSGMALGLTTNWLFYPATLALTIGLAGLSYRFYESPFLRLKSKFAKVESGAG